MIENLKVLAIIPARGGSKEIPQKNIVKIAGKPLIAWTINEAKKSKYIDRLILSSDDQQIISIAKKYGCETPFIRPKYLATDKAKTIDTVIHAIKKIKVQYDLIVLLQPTSPLRNSQHIDEAIEHCVSLNADSCVSVSEPSKSPYWTYTINQYGRISPIIKSSTLLRRQDLPKTYSLNGAIYVAKISFVLKNKSFIGKNTVPYIMDELYSLDIDTNLDKYIADYILSKIIKKQFK